MICHLKINQIRRNSLKIKKFQKKFFTTFPRKRNFDCGNNLFQLSLSLFLSSFLSFFLSFFLFFFLSICFLVTSPVWIFCLSFFLSPPLLLPLHILLGEWSEGFFHWNVKYRKQKKTDRLGPQNLKASFWELLRLIPGNLIFRELTFSGKQKYFSIWKMD